MGLDVPPAELSQVERPSLLITLGTRVPSLLNNVLWAKQAKIISLMIMQRCAFPGGNSQKNGQRDYT